MSLESYFLNLIKRVEASDQITNAGKDANGFYKPTRTVVLANLNLLKDLHSKPGAKPMVQAAWKEVVEALPSEWLVLSPEQKKELQKILS